MELTLTQILIAVSIIFIAYFVASITGFGDGLISVPLLALIVDIKMVIPILAITGIILNLDILRRNKTYLNQIYKNVIYIILGGIVGVAIGTFLLSSYNDNFLQRFLGFLILIFALNTLFNRSFNIPKNRFLDFIAGLFSGFLQGAFNINSPPLVIYYSNQKIEKTLFRATLILIFSIVGIWQISFLIVTNLIDVFTILSSVTLIPIILLASYLGHRVHLTINQKVFNILVSVLLFASAFFLIF